MLHQSLSILLVQFHEVKNLPLQQARNLLRDFLGTRFAYILEFTSFSRCPCFVSPNDIFKLKPPWQVHVVSMKPVPGCLLVPPRARRVARRRAHTGAICNGFKALVYMVQLYNHQVIPTIDIQAPLRRADVRTASTRFGCLTGAQCVTVSCPGSPPPPAPYIHVSMVEEFLCAAPDHAACPVVSALSAPPRMCLSWRILADQVPGVRIRTADRILEAHSSIKPKQSGAQDRLVTTAACPVYL